MAESTNGPVAIGDMDLPTARRFFVRSLLEYERFKNGLIVANPLLLEHRDDDYIERVADELIVMYGSLNEIVERIEELIEE